MVFANLFRISRLSALVLAAVFFMILNSSAALAERLLENWLSSVGANQENRTITKQIENLSSYNGSPNQALEYEPTGERFQSRLEIESALIQKNLLLQKLSILINSSATESYI